MISAADPAGARSPNHPRAYVPRTRAGAGAMMDGLPNAQDGLARHISHQSGHD